MFSNFRRRRGLDRRTERSDELIPWAVAKAHRWAYPLMMLRTEARRRAGLPVADDMLDRLDRWRRRLRRDNLVVAYEPFSEDGFHYVPRRRGVDADLIRVPDGDTSKIKLTE